jgi:hypothetical protein
MRTPRAVRPAVLLVVLFQLVAVVLFPDLAYPAAAGNSGDSAAYASIETLLVGLPLVCAALALLRWPRVGVVAVSLLELWFVAATRVSNSGTYSGGLTPFVVGALIVLTGYLAKAVSLKQAVHVRLNRAGRQMEPSTYLFVR